MTDDTLTFENTCLRLGLGRIVKAARNSERRARANYDQAQHRFGYLSRQRGSSKWNRARLKATSTLAAYQAHRAARKTAQQQARLSFGLDRGDKVGG
jgi:hypothetical protein